MAGQGQVFGRCQLLRYLLGRQGLIERLPSTEELLGSEAWSWLGPLHTTRLQTPYLSLLARVEDFPEQWRRLAEENRAYVPGKHADERGSKHYHRQRCMRGTLHLLPAHALSTVTAAYGPDSTKGMDMFRIDVAAPRFSLWATRILLALYKATVAAGEAVTKVKGKRKREQVADVALAVPTTAVALRKHMQATFAQELKTKKKSKCPLYDRIPSKPKSEGWGVSCRLNWMLSWMWNKGIVENGAGPPLAVPDKEWRMARRTWCLSQKGKELLEAGEDPEETARRIVAELVAEEVAGSTRRHEAELQLCLWYFSIYGPASFKDYQWWTGMTPVARVREPFDQLRAGVTLPDFAHPLGPSFQLVEVEVDGMDEKLYMLESMVPELAATATDAILGGVRLLPYEDAIIKAYKETRYRFFPAFRYGEAGLDRKPEKKKEEGRKVGRKGKVTEREENGGKAAGFREGQVIVRGEAMPSIWLDGTIVGTWTWTNKPEKPIGLSAMCSLTQCQRAAVEDELLRSKALLEYSDIVWEQ